MSSPNIAEASFILPRAVAQLAGLSSTCKLVLAYLADCRNHKTGQCNPRVKTIARHLAVGEKTVDRALAKLYRCGLVRRHKGQRGNSFDVAPRAGWAKILRGQNDPAETIPAGSKWPCARGQNDPAEAPVSLYEPLISEPKKRGAAAAFSGVVQETGRAQTPAAAATSTAALAGKSANTNTLALARKLTAELIAVHPQPGLPQKAEQFIGQLLAEAENPEETAAVIRRNHPPWIKYWSGLFQGQFVPMLWRWIRDGEWQHPPVIRKAMERAEDRKARLAERLRQYASGEIQ